MLNWDARGIYKAFSVSRNGKVIADSLPGDARSFKDTGGPDNGKVTYAVQPINGTVTPAKLVVNLGPIESGGSIIYEPFDYPADAGVVQFLNGKGGALGTKGGYVYLRQELDRQPAAVAKVTVW